jgi:hypothetical protein
MFEQDEQVSRISPDSALAMMIDTDLTTSQYNTIREQSNMAVKNLYPSYYKVKESKNLCYPDDIQVTETEVKIPLQNLMDLTVKRLCAVQSEVFSIIPDVSEVHLVCKWGCDGSQQSRYKQKFSPENENATDDNLFSFSLVPIQLYGTCGNIDKKII